MKTPKPSLRAKYSTILREREKDTDLSIAAFCKKHGISPAAFYYWKNILRVPTVRYPRARFVPVTVAALSPPINSAGHHYDFRFPNGAALHISGFLNTADLSELIGSVGKLAS